MSIPQQLSLVPPASGTLAIPGVFCPECRGQHIVVRPRGPHVGAYCARCGAWVKWLNSAEREAADQAADTLDRRTKGW